ncbi:hypothetical protein D3C87_955970 [compost metagenome]
MVARDDGPGEAHLGVARVEGAGLEAGERLFDLGQGQARGEPVVVLEQGVGHGHDLAVHVLGGVGEADVVVEGLGHLLDAVRAFEDRVHHHDLGALAVRRLDLAAHEEVELLVGAAHLDVRLDGDRVVALHQGVEELVEGDGIVALVALGKVIARQHLGDRGLGRQFDGVSEGHAVQPLPVPVDLGLGEVEDQAQLVEVGLGVLLDFLEGEGRPGGFLTGGVADPGGEVADDDDHLVTCVLKTAQAVQDHGMAQVQIGLGGVETELDAERPIEILELGFKGALRKDLKCSLREFGEDRILRKLSGQSDAPCWGPAKGPTGT